MKLFIIAMLALFCASCDGQGNATPPPPKQQYPNPAPAGIWDPHQPHPYPDFELPEGCEHNPENPWQGVCGEIYLDLGVLFKPSADIKAQDWRDQRYDWVSCQKQDEKDLWINCARGFQKSELEVAGRYLYLFQYFGVMGDLDQPVNELFWDDPQWAVGLTIHGDFEAAKPAWESLLKTLQYHYEVPADSFQK